MGYVRFIKLNFFNQSLDEPSNAFKTLLSNHSVTFLNSSYLRFNSSKYKMSH